jgi:hypothetical protein
MPGSNCRRVLSAKLLKPVISICFRYTETSNGTRLFQRVHPAFRRFFFNIWAA